MRVRAATIQNILLGLALLAGVLWNLAHASEINDLRVATGSTGTRAEILLDGTGEYQLISLAGPDRLVVDLPGAKLGAKVSLPAGAGLVKAVRRGQPVPGTTRIVFDLAAPVAALKPRLEPAGNGGSRLVIEWPGDGEPAVAAATPAAATATAPPAAPSPDPAIASAAATSRLVSGLPQAQAPVAEPVAATRDPVASSSPASPPQPQPTSAPSLQRTVPESNPAAASPANGMPVVRESSGTIATGVPTRIATGVPTQVAPAVREADPPRADPKADAREARAAQDAARRAGVRPLVIAIDAGHGGQDPGAIGPAGTYEKHVTLAIARELARQINATPGMRAYLVRDNDVYVERPQRSRRARQAKADMFVSIHADAAQNRSAYGSSVYTLSTRGASSQHARWLADRENTSDLIGGRRIETGNSLSNVLLDLMQSGHMKASQDAARHVLGGLRDLGKAHKPNVEYANFEVLRNADMPAMLVETGFISNVEEEKRLTNPAHQRRVAQAVLQGINDFYTSQPPPGTLFAARAQAQSGGGSGGGQP